jgi:hypothetical protein
VLQFSAVSDLFRVALTSAAAIQATGTAQSGLRMTMAETVGAGLRPKLVASDVNSVPAKAS